MARLIEVEDAPACPSPLTVRAGDVILFRAGGGRVRSGGDVIELSGAFLTAVVGTDGAIVTPAGPPDTVLFRAQRSGRAAIDVITGHPFHAARTTHVEIAVES